VDGAHSAAKSSCQSMIRIGPPGTHGLCIVPNASGIELLILFYCSRAWNLLGGTNDPDDYATGSFRAIGGAAGCGPRRVGVLTTSPDTDARWRTYLIAFTAPKLGWIESQNLRIEYRRPPARHDDQMRASAYEAPSAEVGGGA
jgi:hypothetical protein